MKLSNKADKAKKIINNANKKVISSEEEDSLNSFDCPAKENLACRGRIFFAKFSR